MTCHNADPAKISGDSRLNMDMLACGHAEKGRVKLLN